MTIAYLTGAYPKVSHTFIAREVAALRARGMDVRTCTVRRACPSELGTDQAAEAEATFAILDRAGPLRLLTAHAGAIRAHPRGWLRAARLAWRIRPPGLRAGLRQIAYLAEAGILAAHLRRIGARHLHNHFADSSCTVAMLCASMMGLRFSFTLHGPTELYAPEWWQLGEKAARAAFSAHISHFARSQAMLFTPPEHWARMRVVHCGVDPTRLPFRGPARGTGPGGPHILFVGRLAGVKGAPLLLEACATLSRRHPALRLTLVGDGPERPALEAHARALGLEAAFTGYLTEAEVAERLAQADMLALPSFAEGVPVVLMEAMASGLPVVASRIMGIPELVEDGASGLLVPPGDVAELTRALGRLAADPALGARMGREGRARVEAQFDIGAEAAWLAALFEGSLAGALPEGLRPEAPPPRLARVR